MRNHGALGIFQSTPTHPPCYPQPGRLHGHQIDPYIEEPKKQCCPEGGGDSEAQSGRSQGRNHSPAQHRGPQGNDNPKPSKRGQEGGVHSEAPVSGQDCRGGGEESCGSCQEGR
jgi:hypothetical protein